VSRTARQASSSTFTARLFRYKGKAAWYFAEIPKRHAPKPTHPWGRTPVVATVDGHTWTTSVWRAKEGDGSLLAVPKKIRGTKRDGDAVRVRLELIPED
jgi:uncharacterized protein DUF1905